MSLDHILLGLLREPQSGYELKAYFDRSLAYFWPAELSQIYRHLKRLEEGGHLNSEKEESEIGPDRKVYSITESGRALLLDWVTDEPQFGDERFSFLAQIFFMGECQDLEKTRAFVLDMQLRFDIRLATYQQIDQAWQAGSADYPALETDDGFHMHLTLRMGLHRFAAAAMWCHETLIAIDERISGQKNSQEQMEL